MTETVVTDPLMPWLVGVGVLCIAGFCIVAGLGFLFRQNLPDGRDGVSPDEAEENWEDW